MLDEPVSKVNYRLDWQRVEQLIEQHFDREEQAILNGLFGLNQADKLTIRQLAKQHKMKIKPLTQRIEKLEKQLYKILKSEDLDDLIQEHLEELSLSEEVAQLVD